MRSIIFVSFVFLILAAGIVSADFDIGKKAYSIQTEYGASQDIKGWINISLDNEPTNSIFEDSWENSISLIDLLNLNDADYDCVPVDCETDYSISGSGTTSKTFSLIAGESKTIGLKASGNINSITSVNFNIYSNAGASCTNQLKVDFFADDNSEFINNRVDESGSCSSLRNYGCFDDEKSYTEYYLDGSPYCQQINVSESPGFSLGAWIKKEAGASRTIKMALYDENGVLLESCTLPGVALDWADISCDVDYPTSEEKYFVCIYSESGSGIYKIKGYSDYSNGCAFHGTPVQTEMPGAFGIFAEGKRFDSVGTLQITNSFDGESLSELIEDFIIERYGSLDCSDNCVIPIKFIAEKSQTIALSNLLFEYEEIGPTSDNRFYDLDETPAKITSDFQKLNLDDAEFSVPDEIGEETFSLDLNEKNIFSKDISIKEVPVIDSLSPLTTASAYPTEFKASGERLDNVTKFKWDFGDNSTETTTTNKVTHTYAKTGNYSLTITITDENGFDSSEDFEIIVRTPQQEIDENLEKIKENIDYVKIQIEKYDFFYQDSLNSALNLSFAEEELERLEKANNASNKTESVLNKIMTDLLKLNIPESIFKTGEAKLITYYPQKENVDIGIIETISGETYSGSEEEGANALLTWGLENLDTKISFTEISARYTYEEDVLLEVFEFSINQKDSLNYPFYLIIPELEGLRFKKNYFDEKQEGYTYLNIEDENSVVFSTTEKISFSELPVFISPEIDQLSLVDSSLPDDGKDNSKKTIFILSMILLVIVGIVTYIIIREWYKKKYENYLFKNKNNLYNLFTYIGNAKKRGLNQKEIAKNLKKQKWNSEQINYALKKFHGKRTGLP